MKFCRLRCDVERKTDVQRLISGRRVRNCTALVRTDAHLRTYAMLSVTIPRSFDTSTLLFRFKFARVRFASLRACTDTLTHGAFLRNRLNCFKILARRATMKGIHDKDGRTIISCIPLALPRLSRFQFSYSPRVYNLYFVFEFGSSIQAPDRRRSLTK